MLFRILGILLLVFYPFYAYMDSLPQRPTEFVIVVPSHNNERFCIQNLTSIVQQTYPHWHLFYIDDASSDKTGQLVDDFVKTRGLGPRCTIVHNKKRKGSLANIYDTIHKVAPYKVIVTVDGDDRLAHHSVLEILASIYADKNVWLTYGNFTSDPPGWGSCCEYIPPAISNARSFRSYRWVFGHLRTFYAKLFQLIKIEDFQWKGVFFPMVGDMAFMFPMAEMASRGHIRFIPDTLYIYNVANPINDHRVNASQLQNLDRQIRHMPPYQPLNKLFD